MAIDADDELDTLFDDIWVVHEHPDRPLDRKALLCGCRRCRTTLQRTAVESPHFVLGVKTYCDRLLVTAEYLVDVMTRDRSLSELFYVADDGLREIYIPVAGGWLPPGQRWWSMTCDEDRVAGNRRRSRHTKARRQPKRDVERRRREWREEQASRPPSPPPPPLVPFAEAVREARTQHRTLLAAAAEWALANGCSLDLDVAALIVDATRRTPITRPTKVGVNDLLGSRCFNWCSLRRTLTPDRIPETLWVLLDFLYATDRVHPDSDPLEEVRKPLRCYCGLGDDGERRSDEEIDRDRARDDWECDCFVEYHGPTHGELREWGEC